VGSDEGQHGREEDIGERVWRLHPAKMISLLWNLIIGCSTSMENVHDLLQASEGEQGFSVNGEILTYGMRSHGLFTWYSWGYGTIPATPGEAGRQGGVNKIFVTQQFITHKAHDREERKMSHSLHIIRGSRIFGINAAKLE
jgi:hypothetical protein